MVVVDQDCSADTNDNAENVETESKNSDSENSDKAELKTEIDNPPTEIERIKVFTRKVARCAAKSFCETYVHPLVIKNPNSLPNKSRTVDLMSQNQEDQRAILLNPEQRSNEEQAAIILNPEQEKEEDDYTPLQNQWQDIQEAHNRQAEVVNPNKKENLLEATVNVLREEQMITIDKRKPSLSFDIANILSYLPCQSLIAVSEERDDIDVVNLGMTEPRPCGSTCSCSQSHINDDETEQFDEDASPTKEN